MNINLVPKIKTMQKMYTWTLTPSLPLLSSPHPVENPSPQLFLVCPSYILGGGHIIYIIMYIYTHIQTWGCIYICL